MKGVILLTYGTPASLGDVEAYYTHILGGRKPPPALLDDLVERYRAIGGTSPLVKITEAQTAKLQRRLAAEGSGTRVYCGMKHSPPFVSDVVKQASEDGVTDLLVLPLAPHYSKMSSGTYVLAVEMANNTLAKKMNLDFILSWHTNPLLVDAWAKRIARAEKKVQDGYSMIFSAHSLPEKILALGDPYRDQLLLMSDLVAAKAGKKEWSFAFQSRSHTPEPWLGPDILDHLQSLWDGGKRSFLIAPVGFVADHLEVLYDIDVECRRWAKETGSTLERCDSLNDGDDFTDCLYSIVAGKRFV